MQAPYPARRSEHETITIAPPSAAGFLLLKLGRRRPRWSSAAGRGNGPLTLIKDGGNMATFAVMTPTY
ncbi:membrane channel protein of phosphonate transporter [Shigella flexneri]